MQPRNANVFSGENAQFQCQYSHNEDEDAHLTWIVNGITLNRVANLSCHFEEEAGTLSGMNELLSFLNIVATPGCNETQVQCVVAVIHTQTISFNHSHVAVLFVQGISTIFIYYNNYYNCDYVDR